jgi:uncharacterized caspase-like protein
VASRRQVLKRTLAASLTLGGAPHAALANIVQGASKRTALVIGNEQYRYSPLGSAANDARAMADLLTQAGFVVDLRLNATRDQMLRAIEALGAAITTRDVETSLFYYAGHAAQLDWRNYLLPVDGDVAAAGDIRKQCIDLGLLLDQLGRANSKTSLIILDSCRDDPFGPRFRPKQKGMSQYDAPPGTLLAFATAPGSVAIEIQGRPNGLYTENLVRELSVKGVRVEDALKRVRLNVRYASRGMQVPWESTSLESDVYLFPAPARSAADLEREAREELELWNSIKASKKLDDWMIYLRRFPQGRFAEVAQVQTRELLAKKDPAPRVATASARPAAVRLGPKLAVPARFQGSGNPNSAGTYPFRPVWTVGDEFVFDQIDRYSNVAQRRYRIVVKRVDVENNRVELADGSLVDPMGGILKEGKSQAYDLPIQINPAELQVGHKWTSRFQASGFVSGAGDYEFKIVRREMVEVPAGKFSAFRIEGVGLLPGLTTANRRVDMTRWVVPGLNFNVRREVKQSGLAYVLVSARQAASA